MEIKLKPSQLKRLIIFKSRQVYSGEKLADLINEFGPDGQVDVVSGYYGDPDEFHIFVSREETDEEYNARIADLIEIEKMVRANKAKAKADKEAKERKEYERLRKKFEGK